MKSAAIPCAITATLLAATGVGALSQTNRNPPLIDAIRKGDASEEKRLLDTGADPNCREIRISVPSLEKGDAGGKPYAGDTALIIAVKKNRATLVRLLLRKGANINLPGYYGYTPLMAALDLEMARLLLDLGAKPNLRNGFGHTALDFAANGDNRELVLLLLKHGANINGGTSTPPLVTAAMNCQVEMVRLLVRKGADVNLRRGGLSPLEAARNQAGTHLALEPEIETIIKRAGGKARPAAEIEKESQRRIEDWRAREIMRLPVPQDTLLTDEDTSVLNAVLKDLADYKGKDLSVFGRESTVVLIDTTSEGIGDFGEGQLNSELDEAQANDVTLEMRDNLVRRNVGAVSLKGFRPSDPRIQVKDAKTGMSGGRLGNPDAKVKMWVVTNLPGYSKLHDRAVVRFSFGPSPHGAAGTYFLVKERGVWRVKWRDFAFYV